MGRICVKNDSVDLLVKIGRLIPILVIIGQKYTLNEDLVRTFVTTPLANVIDYF